jgi:dynein heavy chain
LKSQLRIKGVQSKRMNPKSLALEEFFGKFEEESHTWEEGIFTKIFREFSFDSTSKKKWIILDGPIDHSWVENLNSILDDNKKINLANGETICMSTGMTILLESDSLIHTTPATISRCGLIYLE